MLANSVGKVVGATSREGFQVNTTKRFNIYQEVTFGTRIDFRRRVACPNLTTTQTKYFHSEV